MFVRNLARDGGRVLQFTRRPRSLFTDLRYGFPHSSHCPNARNVSAASEHKPPQSKTQKPHLKPSDKDIPRVAEILGYSGLIPFMAGAAAAASPMVDQYVALHVSQVYGASILSFLGAVHWGVALSETAARNTANGASSDPLPAVPAQDFMYGVIPSLVGWGAALLDPRQGIVVLTPALMCAFGYDSYRFRGQGAKSVPAWYFRLRRRLTVGAVLSLGFSFGVSDPRNFAGGGKQENSTWNPLENLIVNVSHTQNNDGVPGRFAWALPPPTRRS
jgi:Protein of unknown function (DUF3429)